MRFAMHGSSRRKKTLNYLRFTIADLRLPIFSISGFLLSQFPLSRFINAP
jgi:hypothetical protein